jgi:hypothetical protein
MRLVREQIEVWVEALRSGEYEQGGGRLRRGERYCVLGVLCDTLDPSGWVTPVYTLDSEWKGDRYGLPGWVLRDLAYTDLEARLVHDNDYGVSFEALARLIEAQLDRFPRAA